MDFTTRTMRLNNGRRKLMNWLVTGLAVLSTVVVLVPLVAILGYLLYKGASSLNLNFFIKVPAPVGESGGGMANSIAGSAVILTLASLMGIPVGIAAGVYLAEYGRGKLLGNAVRFTADVLNGVPSIVMGIAIYALIVMQQKHFSAFAGGVALAIMMVPTITRTTERDAFYGCRIRSAKRRWGWVCRSGARRFRWRCGRLRRALLRAACWRLRGSRVRRLRCCLRPWVMTSGVCG